MPQRNAAIPALGILLLAFFILGLGLNLVIWLGCLPFKLILRSVRK